MAGKFEVYQDKAGEYRFRLKAGNGDNNILAVALDSGFRSKSTFNKIFKRFTGLTPSVYRREHTAA